MTNETIYSAIPAKKSVQSKKTHKKSHIDVPLSHKSGELHGASRGGGDISEDIRRKIIDMVIDEAVRRNTLSYREIAHLLAIFRIESGFNPDAANGDSSASGIGQMNDDTAEDIKTYTNTNSWKKNNKSYIDIDVTNPADRFNARKNIIASIILFERCKSRAISRFNYLKIQPTEKNIEERIYQYYKGGIYFDSPPIEINGVKTKDTKKFINGKDNNGALATYKNELLPFIDQAEKALKKPGKAVMQFNHADGKPASREKVAVIAPKSLTKRIWEYLFGNPAQEAATTAPANKKSPPQVAQAAVATTQVPVAPSTNTAAPKMEPTPAKPVAAVQPQHPNNEAASTTTPADKNQAPKVSFPPNVTEKNDKDLEVIIIETNSDGSLPIELPIGTGVVNVCLLGKGYEKRVQDFLKQKEELPEEASPEAEEKNEQPPVEDETAEQPTEPAIPAYCDRTPSDDDLARAFAKANLTYIPELIGFKRSYVLKSPTIAEAILNPAPSAPAPQATQAASTENKPAAPAPKPASTLKPEVHVVTSSQPKPPPAPLATVTTAKQPASTTATGPRATPWMDVARAEYAKKISRVAGVAGTKKYQDDIKKIVKENNEIKSEIGKAKSKAKKERRDELQDPTIKELKEKLASSEKKLADAVKEMRKVQDDPAVNNPSIIKYLMTTNVAELIKTNQAIDDEIAWCASFVNWCLLNSTPKQDAINSATAEHWKNYGEPAPIGTLGAITVVKTDGGHHVGFFAGYYKKEGQFIMLGGNQGYDIDTNTHSKQTRISRCNFSTSQIVGNRMPPAKKENK